jgi:hypothetical protein
MSILANVIRARDEVYRYDVYMRLNAHMLTQIYALVK